MGLKQKIQEIFHNIKTDINYQLGIMAFVLIIGAIIVWVGVWYSSQQNTEPQIIASNNNVNVNTDATIEADENIQRKIDGLLVAPPDSNKYPIAVMIENLASDEVRPQYGLSRAQVVYEIVVEAGITRFMAVFASNENLTQIGPVRSARPTFIEYVSEYNALYSHAGGSPEALESIDGLSINDCSALSADSRFFWRDPAKGAPHNLFTSSELLNYALRDKNLSEAIPEYESWKFEDEKNINPDSFESEKYVKIDFSTPEYFVEWKYDLENNAYTRFNAGNEQRDALNDSVISAKNVIIQVVPNAISAGDDGRVNFDVNGEGKAYIFNNGEKKEGTWKKSGRISRTKYFNANGEEIPLVRGNAWIEIVPIDRTIESN